LDRSNRVYDQSEFLFASIHSFIKAQNYLRFTCLRNRKVKAVAGPEVQNQIACKLGCTAELLALWDRDRATILREGEEARTRLLCRRGRYFACSCLDRRCALKLCN